MSAFTSVESATGTGIGESRQLQKATAHHTMIVSVEGAVTDCAVALEGSHDGFRWVRIQMYQAAENGIITTPPTGALMTHIRANVLKLDGVGGKITASIASADA